MTYKERSQAIFDAMVSSKFLEHNGYDRKAMAEFLGAEDRGDNMTPEKAIKKLEETVGAYILSGKADGTRCGEWREIFEALKPCEDCISRQAVIDKIVNSPSDVYQDMYKTKYDGSVRRQNEIISMINEMPSVTPRKKDKRIKQESILDKIKTEIKADRERISILIDDEYYRGKISGYDCVLEMIDNYMIKSEEE